MFRKHYAAAEEGAGGGGAPAPAPSATQTPAAAPPAAPAAPPTEDPSWLKTRLDREREAGKRAALAELGVTDSAAAKATLDAATKAAEANKSAEIRSAELAAKLTGTEAANARLLEITKEHAARMIAVLTTEQQAAVNSIVDKAAGGRPELIPALQLDAIAALGPTWAAQAPAAQPAAPVAPASTAPAATAPPATGGTSPPNHREVYTSLRTDNPFAAAAYGLRHRGEVYSKKT